VKLQLKAEEYTKKMNRKWRKFYCGIVLCQLETGKDKALELSLMLVMAKSLTTDQVTITPC
jgi:hypothetical protein